MMHARPKLSLRVCTRESTERQQLVAGAPNFLCAIDRYKVKGVVTADIVLQTLIESAGLYSPSLVDVNHTKLRCDRGLEVLFGCVLRRVTV